MGEKRVQMFSLNKQILTVCSGKARLAQRTVGEG